jgi:hypothetical protein
MVEELPLPPSLIRIMHVCQAVASPPCLMIAAMGQDASVTGAVSTRRGSTHPFRRLEDCTIGATSVCCPPRLLKTAVEFVGKA